MSGSNIFSLFKLAILILKELEKQPIGHSKLETIVIRKSGTHSTFTSMFRSLKAEGYLRKSGPEYRAPYVITDKGRRFMELATEFLPVVKAYGGGKQ